MNITGLNDQLSLLTRISDIKKPTEAFYIPEYDKPVVTESIGLQGWDTATPESQGIDSDDIASFIRDLNNDKTLNMHDVIILRNGKVLTTASFGEQKLGYWKYTFSACKSVTSLAIGMLIDDGMLSLNDKVISYFEEYSNPVLKLKLKDFTVEHLLTMTSGIYFNEAECMTKENWVQGFLNSMAFAEPGKLFVYNSLNTYMLSAIVSKVAGRDMFDFLTDRLFTPLGITDVYWEKCPKGISKGGWGLYIKPLDFAKIGQMVMNHGEWNGQRIISEDYLERATTKKQTAPKDYGDFNYAYQIWVGREEPTFLFNGMLGQNVWGFYDSGILIVSNAGNDESFQQSNYFKIVQKYFGGGKYSTVREGNEYKVTPLPENPMKYAKLKEFLAQLETGDIQRPMMRFWTQLASKLTGKFPKELEKFADKTWVAKNDITNSMGVMPLCLQVLQNNYSKGLLSVGLKQKDGDLVFVYKEEGATYEFPIGFQNVNYLDMEFNGESFKVAVTGRYGLSEEGDPMLRIQISFVETPFTRLIKLYFLDEDEMKMIQDERPGETFVVDFMGGLKSDYESKPFIGSALAKLDMDYVNYKVARTFHQELHMTLNS